MAALYIAPEMSNKERMELYLHLVLASLVISLSIGVIPMCLFTVQYRAAFQLSLKHRPNGDQDTRVRN
jgi:hypothetical protein